MNAATNINIEIPEAFQELFNPWRYKIFYGGRGSAKSWSVARALVLLAMGSKLRILCGREYQASIAESAKHLIEEQIHLMGLDHHFSVGKKEINCRVTGAKFLFYGFRHDPQKIKSLEDIDICWIEEANTMTVESWKYLVPTIRKDGSEIWATFNPHLTTDPIYSMFVDEKTPKRPNAFVRKVNYDENPWFTETLREEMEWDKQHDYETYMHIWEGMTITHSKSLVFSGKWRIDGMIEPKPDETLYYGADWGFAQDPSTLLRCWVNHKKREIYIDHEVYGVGVEIDDTPDMFALVPGSQKWEIRADSARPETISYMNRHGFRVVGAKKGPGSVEEGVNFLKSYTIVVHPRCKRLIAELGLYSYKVDKMTEEVLPLLVDKHNHMIDALRYALEKFAFHQKRIGTW